MKLRILLLPFLAISMGLTAQAPTRFSYQSVVRNPANILVANGPVGLEIKIRQGSSNGTVVYQETHALTSNSNGLITAEIGSGQVVSGSMAGIVWSAGPYFLEASTDPFGGTTYSLSSTRELLSVPYALYAETAGNSGGGSMISAGTGLTLNGNVMDAQTTTPLWNANALQSGPISTASPLINDVLTWNGISWIPAAPSGGGGGGGTTVNCNTTSNTNYTIRGTGSGNYECTNAIVITSTDKVGIGTTTPSSSFDLSIGTGGFLVNGSSTTSNISGRLRIGSTSSSTYDLQVDGQAYITSGIRVGTTSSPSSGGILANNVIETNQRFIQGSSTTGTGTAIVRTSSGELRPQSSTIHVKTNVNPLQVNKENLFRLRPVSYQLKPALGGDSEVGLIAEEVHETLPELVVYGPERQWIGDSGLPATDKNGKEIVNPDRLVPYSVHYDRLPVYLLQIIKEQDKRIQELELRLQKIEEKK